MRCCKSKEDTHVSALKANLGYIVYNSTQDQKIVTIILNYENQGLPTKVCNSLEISRQYIKTICASSLTYKF